jgi:hypothetical protein
MANKFVSFSTGVQSGATGGVGPSVISTNQRARTPMGALGLSTDVVIFAGGTGKWFFTNQRVRVSGTPTVSTTSFGQAVEGNLSGPMTVIVGDPRAAGM